MPRSENTSIRGKRHLWLFRKLVGALGIVSPVKWWDNRKLWKNLNKGYAQADPWWIKTHSTFGNLNNHLGVPLTILTQDSSVHEFSVIEAGINQRDEMATLAKMIEPEYVIVTSIGNSHLEGLG